MRSRLPKLAGGGALASATPWMAALLAAYALLQYPFVFGMPFVSDDYAILDKVRGAGFASLWTAEHPLWRWYRPWSRELHFWTLERLFGARELPFHVASLALWVAVLTAYFALVRRLSGTSAAVVAAAGAAAAAAWASTLFWAAGAEELWMLLFALLFLHATARRSAAASLVTLAGALLSKETAAVLPAIAFLYAWRIDRERPGAALRRVAPQLAMVALWAGLHPFLRARLAGHAAEAGAGAAAPSPAAIALRTVLSIFNLEPWPEPEVGWLGALLPALPGIALLAGGVAWALRRPRAATSPSPPPDARRAALFGVGWALLGALPLFMPTVGWLSYYALLSALGVWTALASFLAPRPRLAVAAVTLVAALRPAHAATPSYEWGSDWHQRRAAYFVGRLREDLLRRHPTLPPHSRLFFTQVPNGTGIGQPWFDPAFRVWYPDSGVTGGLYADYLPRGADRPRGHDFFFRCNDSAFVWVEVVRGPEDVARERRENRGWESDHRHLALTLGNAGDWAGAAEEIGKLVAAFPSNPGYPLNLSLCLGNLGDTLGMKRALRLADSLRSARPGSSGR